jgi:hypothetical protein
MPPPPFSPPPLMPPFSPPLLFAAITFSFDAAFTPLFRRCQRHHSAIFIAAIFATSFSLMPLIFQLPPPLLRFSFTPDFQRRCCRCSRLPLFSRRHFAASTPILCHATPAILRRYFSTLFACFRRR